MSVYSYTTDSIEIFEDSIIYGSLADTPTEIIDGGDILVSANIIENNGYIVNTQTIYPFGSAKVFGNSESSFSRSSTTKVESLKLTSKITEGIRFTWIGSGTLFEIGGGQERIIAPWVGSSGPLRIFGSAATSAVYQYDQSSISLYSIIDFGGVLSTPNTSINYGVLFPPVLSEEDYGSIVIASITYPHGLFKISGAFSDLTRTFGHQSQGTISLNGSAQTDLEEPSTQIYKIESTDLFKVSGLSNNNFTRSTYISSGRITLFNSVKESSTTEYNQSSISLYSLVDFGNINSQPSSSVDQGIISLPALSEENYGSILITNTTYPYGLLNLSGSVLSSTRTFGYQSQGIISLNGSAQTSLVEPSTQTFRIRTTDLFKVSGYSSIKFTKALYIGSGSLSFNQTRKESATYDYNLYSEVEYNVENYGLILDIGTSVDSGFINVPVTTGEESYGYISSFYTERPFGSLSLLGSSTTILKPSFAYVGKGSLFAAGGEGIITSFGPDGFALFDIFGYANTSIIRNYNSTGSVFTFSNTEESITFDYNDKSIELFSEEDYQFITSSGSSEDYGFITLTFDAGEESYGYIGNLTTAHPFGSVATFNGSVEVIYKPSFSQRGKAHISIIGNTSTEFIPSYDSFGLFNITGGERYSRAIINASVASFFAIGSKQESASFDYNDNSVESFSEEDYEFITSTGSSEDYGLINSELDAGEDSYGYIGNLTTVYPFGSVGTLHGLVVVDYRPTFSQVGKAHISVIGDATAEFIPSYDSFGLFNITGGERYSRAIINVSKASLFTIGFGKDSATFDYNNNSIVFFSEEDYEFITSIGSVEDYGLINSELNSGEDSYGYIGNLTTVYPFGSVGTLHGLVQVDYKPSFSQVGKAHISVIGEATAEFIPSYDSFGLFNVTGGDRYSRTIINVSTASLFAIGSDEGSVTFDYNTSSVVFFSEEDYQFITSSGSTEDYGFINSQLDAGEDSYGYIRNLTTVYPFGSVGTLSSTTNEAFTPSPHIVTGSLFGLNGVAESSSVNSQESTALFKFSGTSVERNTESYFGSGSLFTINGLLESAAFDYNTSSVIFYEEEDYQFITASGSVEDYGLINSEIDAGEDSYGYIFNKFTQYPFGSIGPLHGIVVVDYKPTFSQVGKARISIIGDSTAEFIPSYDSFGLFNITGGERYSRAIINISTASVLSFGITEDSATFDYNDNSIVFFTEEDYEFITSSGSTEDCGLINSKLDAGEDSYGYIGNLTTVYPFGSIGTLGGSVTVDYKPSFSQVGKAHISVIGNTSTEFVPSYDSFGLFNITGGDRYSRTIINVSIASLFTIGSDEGSVTFDYNTSSVVFFSEEDYEFITSTGSTEDYGFIYSQLNAGEDSYGYIGNLTTAYPFGSIGTLSSTTNEAFTPSPHIVTGSLFGLSGVAESVGINPQESTALFKFSGTLVERNTEFYFGSGSLFTLSGLVESATFDYNTSSVVLFSEEDYQFITSSGSTEDYGIINSQVDTGEDSYGYIGNLTTVYPFGSIGTLSSTTNEAFTPSPYNASGTLFGLNGVAESITVDLPEFTGLFKFSGTLVERNTESYAGSGSLFAIGGLVELATFHYNTSSVVFYTEEDYEFITASGSVENYGFINSKLDVGEESYGHIGNLTTVYPFGSIGTLSGHSVEVLVPAFAQSGKAYIRLSGESLHKFVPSYDSFGLFNITGGERYSRAIANVSTASLFSFGNTEELATFDYNTSSVVFFSEEDYQFITLSAEVTENYGSVGLPLDAGEYSYGYIGNLTTVYPFGSIGLFSGFAKQSFTEGVYTASGTLFGLNGVAESITVDLPEFTGLFKFSGSSTESNTESYVGFGSLFAIDGLVESVTTSENITTLFNLYGSAEESFTEGVYTGSGSLFAFVGTAESITVDLPEFTGLFKFFGSSAESNTESYVGVGNTSISGHLVERNTESYVGSGSVSISVSGEEAFAEGVYTGSGSLFAFIGASESVGVDLPEFTTLFKLSGRSAESFSEGNYNGSGTLTCSGFVSDIKVVVAHEAARFNNIFISGSAIDLQTNSYFGSGSLFGYTGSAESRTVDIPEFFGLLSIKGSAKESFTESNYDGSGSTQITGFVSDIKLSYGNVGSGKETLSGISDTRFVPNWNAFGSLFGYSGAAESRTVDLPEFFGLFSINGTKFESYSKAPYVGSGSTTFSGELVERNTESYVGSGSINLSGKVSDIKLSYGNFGSGSLFGYSGAAESKTVDLPEFFGLFNINGTKFESYSKAPYVGSGSVDLTGVSVERNTESYVGFGNTSITGIAKELFVPNNIGFGSVYVYGNLVEKQTDSYRGSGSLFGILGLSESFSADLQITTLFTLSGTSKESHTENYVGVGSVSFGASAKELFTPNNIGSGSLFALSGSSESYTISERSFGLFTISGSKVERTTSDITVIDRFATIYGNSLESHTEVYIGSGSTFINGSSTNNFTSAEIGSGSVYLDGLVVERQTDDYVGSGSLFTFIGSEESVAVSPGVTFGLFTIFGSAIEKNTESYVGSGNTSVFGIANTWFIANNIGSGSVFTYGNAVEKQTDDYVGFGSLFGFRGAQESATVNPTENTVLFRFYGTSTERNTESYVGFGSELLSGTARTKFVPNWNGSGSVNINGSGKESHTEIYIGYITQEISGFATEIIKISSYQGYAEINISGYIIETQSDSYNGSGTLFGISGSEDSASYNPQESTALFGFSGSSTSSSRKHFTGSGSIFEFNGSSESSSKAEESIGLFKFDGSATIVSPRKYNGSGTLSTISGSSESILYNLPEFNGLYSITGYALSNVTSNPPENTAQYIVSGNVSNIKLSHSNKGFGSLFGINGASVVATPSYITEKIEGIRILGSADESYARSSYNASGVQFITGFAESEYRFYEPSFTYVIII